MSIRQSAWFTYILLRLLFFAGPLAVLLLLGIWPWLSAVFAALIGVSLSVILLSKPRSAASESLYAWRNRARTADDVVEDDAVATAENSVLAAESSVLAAESSVLAAESDQTDHESDPEPDTEPESGQTGADPEHQDEQSTRS